jgi:hypothetical protein
MTDQRATESCWLQLSSGRGPVECQIAVARLVVEIVRAAKAAGSSPGRSTVAGEPATPCSGR